MNNEEYCDFCHSKLSEDSNPDMMLTCLIDSDTYTFRRYCSKCREIGEEVSDIARLRIDRLKRAKEYYDPEHEINLIESLYKSRQSNFNISFKNNYNYDESAIHSTILKDGKPIGIITDVTSEKVEGVIWERYMPIVAELDSNKKPVSFEIVY